MDIAFCVRSEHLGVKMSRAQGRHLEKLVDRAVQAQENEHNSPGAPSSLEVCNEVEEFAKHLGFDSVRWDDGLYPVFVKAGNDVMMS